MDESAIYTLLYDLRHSDIKFPLAGFQHTILKEKADFRRLINNINDKQEISVDKDTLDFAYDSVWDKFKEGLSSIPKIAPRLI